MKLKAYKPALLLAALFTGCTATFAQTISIKTKPSVSVSTNFDDKDFQLQMDNLARNLKADLKDLGKNISATIDNITSNIHVNVNDAGDADGDGSPKINLNLDGLLNSLNLNISGDDGGDEVETNSNWSVKEKNYSKSYPLDANDRIRLSNQFGKISVTTWDKHEIKVDIQIKAEAGNDNDAQKLIDGVSISDEKNGDEVAFKTNIRSEDDDNGFWALFRPNGNKKHKLNINYVVYMPAKTDLDVNSSYGSVDLPVLDGKVRISTYGGSTSVESMSNPANEISGSYGSLHIGTMNGGRLSFSYGSVDIDECNNIRAALSSGSFKIGKLKGSGDFDLSYATGGFRIDEIANTVKKLNINSSYSGTSVGISNGSNFDFDITTNYCRFNYNDDKVNITSKNPPDGNRQPNNTRNYKGRIGKGNSNARVTINSSYGGVRFE